MKVLHISSSDSGGAGIAASRLNKALNIAGVDSKLLCVHKSTNDKSIIKYQVPLLNKILAHSKLPIGQNKYLNEVEKYESIYETVSFPEALYDISKHELIRNADIINLHWIGNILNYKKFFSKVKKPIVWTLHDMNPFLGIAHYMGDFINNSPCLEIEETVRDIKIAAYNQHNNIHIVNLCDWMMSHSKNSQAFSSRHHTIIPNSIDTNIFKIRDKKACRVALGIDNYDCVILFCAQSVNNHRKGFDLLIDSLNRIEGNCLLIIIGNTDNVRLPDGLNALKFGSIRDELTMSILYSASDLFLLPSREDNLPNTMVESLCCGTPVISFSNGGMRDIIKNNISGILVDEQSPECLAKAINIAIKSITNFDKMKISSDYSELFSPEVQAKKYIELYNSLI